MTRNQQSILALSILLAIALCMGDAIAGTLKTHGIFSSNMVIQRDKPITIWGWAEPGRKVSVQFGQAKAEATAAGESGRWEVTFPARQADAAGQKLTVTSGDETIEMDNVLIGDVWVMNGQSNMAFGLGANCADLKTATAHLPLLREVRISPNESYTLEKDLPADKVEGWREDFNDATLPVGVIEFCAGGISQSNANFEIWSNHRTGGSFIHESQRLGLTDLEDPTNTGFIPGYDQQIPGLHPKKKHFHGTRAARWALNKVYGMRVGWETVEPVSAERDGGQMVLTFDKPVAPDDQGPIEGFAVAGEDGIFYKAYAEPLITKDQGIWGNKYDRTKLFVWSPLIKEPVAVRYAWARSPMGNLKVNGKPWQPLHSFRTDEWDWPENEDPSENAVTRTQAKEVAQEAAERCEYRNMEEAKRAVEILKQREMLGTKDPGTGQ